MQARIVLRSHSSEPIRPFSRELDRRFVGFGAGVTKEHRTHRGARHQLARKVPRRFVMIEVAGVHQRLRLRRNRLRDRRVRVAQRADRDAADAIEVAAPPVVDQLAAFAGDDVSGARLYVSSSITCGSLR